MIILNMRSRKERRPASYSSLSLDSTAAVQRSSSCCASAVLGLLDSPCGLAAPVAFSAGVCLVLVQPKSR